MIKSPIKLGFIEKKWVGLYFFGWNIMTKEMSEYTEERFKEKKIDIFYYRDKYEKYGLIFYRLKEMYR